MRTPPAKLPSIILVNHSRDGQPIFRLPAGIRSWPSFS